MNFKLGRFFYFTISFIIGTFFFVFGAMGIILPWSPYLQSTISQFIFENTLILSLFGLGFVLIGVSIVVYTFIHSRRRYIQIRSGSRTVSFDENVIEQYLEAYWNKQFPKSHIPFSLTLRKHSIQIVADLPALPLSEQKQFLENVKSDFNDLFGRILGYPYDVHLIASFQSETSTAKSEMIRLRAED